jgi:hypothetical protein
MKLTPPRTQLLSRAEKSSLIINQRGWADERRKKAEKERKTVKRASSRTKDFITHQTTNLRPSLFGRRLLSSNSRNRETSDGHTKYRFPPLFFCLSLGQRRSGKSFALVGRFTTPRPDSEEKENSNNAPPRRAIKAQMIYLFKLNLQAKVFRVLWNIYVRIVSELRRARAAAAAAARKQ